MGHAGPAHPYLARPPAKVWRALTEADRLARWLMPNDFQPVVGHRFTFRTEPRPQQGFDGIVHCEVLELAPQRRLRIAWRGGRLDTTVTWTLEPEGRGTRLVPGARRNRP
ncbi:SRPBCC domain-containing protein [Streptomyces sp. NBC_01537]|uniref:SRPBCC family protein n=1 Tax=Streptomyces sp. NBC_01537 TaxID=2903896 RepID=UPI00386EC72E